MTIFGIDGTGQVYEIQNIVATNGNALIWRLQIETTGSLAVLNGVDAIKVLQLLCQSQTAALRTWPTTAHSGFGTNEYCLGEHEEALRGR